MDDKDVVLAVLSRLAEKIGSDRFELWFGANVRVVVGESALVVQVPNQFHQNWLRRNFRADLEASCQEVLGRPLAIEFRIVASLETKNRSADLKPEDRQQRFGFDEQGAPAPADPNAVTAVLEPPKRTRHEPRPAFSHNRKYATLESFVVGSSNRLAHAAATMVADHPGRTNPLFVYGPTGVGKTHLLEGILSDGRRRHENINAVFLTAEQFTTSFLEALHRTGLPSFRHKHRAVHLLVIDDVHFLAGKRATVVEFLHTLDALVQQGRQLVVSADRSPAEFRDAMPELSTRLGSGMVAKIDPADHATRAGIVRDRACALGLEIDDEVREFLATHLTTHARELTGALHRLLATSRLRREPITKAIAEEALADLIHACAKPVQFQQIDRAVCEVFGVTGESLQASRRAKALNAPRMVAMWLARKHTRAALSEIGEYFGRRSHSTVISAHKAVGKWLADHVQLRLGDKSCNAEDAIRRVEAKLRAG